MIRPEVLDAMVDAGCTPAQIAAAVKADQCRSSGAERQARYRARKKAEQNVTSDKRDVTSVTRDESDADPHAHAGSNNIPPSEEGNIKTSPKGEAKRTTGVVHSLPVNEAFEAWNQAAQRIGLRAVRDHTPMRVRQLKARLSDKGLDGWLSATAEVEACSFLRGDNGRTWQATFDWLVKASNFTKVLEGTYRKPGDKVAAAAVSMQIEDDALWTRRLEAARHSMEWWEDLWGPRPGDSGCRIPQHLLAETDGVSRYGVRWRAMRRSA